MKTVGGCIAVLACVFILFILYHMIAFEKSRPKTLEVSEAIEKAKQKFETYLMKSFDENESDNLEKKFHQFLKDFYTRYPNPHTQYLVLSHPNMNSGKELTARYVQGIIVFPSDRKVNVRTESIYDKTEWIMISLKPFLLTLQPEKSLYCHDGKIYKYPEFLEYPDQQP